MAQLSLADIITRAVTDLKEKFASLVNGVVSVAQGGTGKGSHTSNSVLVGDGTNVVKNVSSASGALYATAANGAPQFGTLPVAQGGTGATTAALARTNLDAAQSDGASGTLKSAEDEIDALEASLAYVESTTATANHAIGDYFMFGNVLMEATAAIATGETINASNATPATVQGQIDTLRGSVAYSGNNAKASINRMDDGTQQFGVLATTAAGHRVAFIVQTNGVVLYDWNKQGGAGEVWNFLTPNVFMGRGSNPSSLTSLDSTNIEAGTYWVNNTSVGGTWPSGRVFGMLLVFRISVSSTPSTQIFLAEGRAYFRQYVNNNWNSWINLTNS